MENKTNKRESERESDSVIDTEEMRATGREAVLLLRREVPYTVTKMGGAGFRPPAPPA